MLWEVEELQKVSEVHPEVVKKALNELWKRNPDLHKEVVINAYLDEKINLGKAAERLNISRLELEQELKEKGIPVRHLCKEDIVAEVEAIKEW
ncbi:MAG: UPF0175 family protein [SAR324 cluster bacterium]|nr:UPF0175 family protein [SAR324 cluster bacterium]